MRIPLALALATALCGSAWAAESDGTRPDDRLTPGEVRTTDRAEICATKTGTVRDVSGAERLAVYRRYGMKGPNDTFPGTNLQRPFEIDHLISLELGGSNDITNLWPQAFNQEYGAHQKDVLENKLHKLICQGQITPQEAQHEIVTDWIASYKKRVGAAP